MSNARVQKRQLEKARQERAASKRERRQSKGQGDDSGTGEDGEGAPPGTFTEAQVLADLAALHARYADGTMSIEELEEARAELVQRLHVD